MGKMFTYQGKTMKTLNAFTGCYYDCYNGKCWARKLVETRLKNMPKYKGCGFSPMYHGIDLDMKFKNNEWVFVTSIGDIAFCPTDNLAQILYVVKNNPQTNFLFCTKNPKTYERFDNLSNIYFGATIETNSDTAQLSKAPSPQKRYEAMRDLPHHYKKFISIEPIIDFDEYYFKEMIINLKPKIVEIGADNYKAGLPEPSATKIRDLIKCMEVNNIEVVQKQGLERLLGTGKEKQRSPLNSGGNENV